jgi:hypothetical protein
VGLGDDERIFLHASLFVCLFTFMHHILFKIRYVVNEGCLKLWRISDQRISCYTRANNITKEKQKIIMLSWLALNAALLPYSQLLCSIIIWKEYVLPSFDTFNNLQFPANWMYETNDFPLVNWTCAILTSSHFLSNKFYITRFFSTVAQNIITFLLCWDILSMVSFYLVIYLYVKPYVVVILTALCRLNNGVQDLKWQSHYSSSHFRCW